jgi:hypothetical protein
MPNSITITATSSASAVPTVGGTNIADTVRLIIGDTDSSNYELSNANLSSLLANAVAFYNTLRPYKKQTTISIVANQADYALPSDCIRPIHIPYRTSPSVTSDTTLVSLWGLNGFISIVPYRDWTDVVLTRISQEYSLRLEGLGAGQAEVTPYLTSYAANKYLRLYPTPTAADSFVLRYLANHPLQGTDYFTIPSEHALYLQKLLLAEVYEVRYAADQSGISEFAAGTTKIKVGNSGKGKNLQDLANDLRQQVRDALSSPIGVVG